jgi:hypothetical protein
MVEATTSALPDDELASRLAEIVPGLDSPTRVELLQALFPVPTAATEEATPGLVALAVHRVQADGSLKTRIATFLAKHPRVVRQLQHTPPPRVSAIRAAEMIAWVVAAIVVAFIGARALTAAPAAAAHRTTHLLGAIQATPLPPPLDPILKAQRAKGHAAPRVAMLPQRSLGATAAIHTTGAPHPRATPFHNVSFAGYFKHVRHHVRRTVASSPRPQPTPTATPEAKPRVHSLFGPLFGPHSS